MKKKNYYEETYRSSIYSILGDQTPVTELSGNMFLNQNRWTAQIFLGKLYQWMLDHASNIPCKSTIQSLVESSNEVVVEPKIIMPVMPQEVDTRLSMALTGGAYHESWHTIYTCKRPLSREEVYDIVEPRLSKAKHPRTVIKIAQDWMNLIEDVRIERLGVKEYPGTWVKMNDLTDYIISRELHNVDYEENLVNIVARVFREYGLGYSTIITRSALSLYEKVDPETVDFVVNGPLRPHLVECRKDRNYDDLFVLRKSLDIALVMEEAAESNNSDLSFDIQDYIDEGCNVVDDTTYENAIQDHVEEEIEKEESDEVIHRDNIDTINYKNVLYEEIKVTAEHVDHVFLSHLRGNIESAERDSNIIANRIRRLLLSKKKKTKRRAHKFGSSIHVPNLIKTYISVEKEEEPRKPFDRIIRPPNENIAAAIIIDESSSMQEHLGQTLRLSIVLSKLIHSLKGVSCISGYQMYTDMDNDTRRYRLIMRNKIYKEFGESTHQAIELLSALDADGGTPMADGIEFALKRLRERSEKHRIIFNITDGLPSHSLVHLRPLLKECDEEEIHLVALGIGPDCMYIKDVFPKYVWSEESSNMVEVCIKRLQEILTPFK